MVDLNAQQLVRLLNDVQQLLASLPQAEYTWSPSLTAVAAEHRVSARNLVHYWAVRQNDLRDLQSRLAVFGLSSLGRSEAHVQATLSLVRSAIWAMLGGQWQPPRPPAVRIEDSSQLLRRRTVDVLGPAPAGRVTRIMVTLPSQAAENPDMVRGLVKRGMNVARINCAHDDAPAWRAMAENVRRATASTGRTCLIAMDLAGPKLRTGPLEPGPQVVKLHPRKDLLGRVSAPAHARLVSASDPASHSPTGLACIPVSGQWLGRRHDGDVLQLDDSRGSDRQLILHTAQTSTAGLGFVIEAAETTYLSTGTVLRVHGCDDPVEVGELPPAQQSLMLHRGDTLELTRSDAAAPVATDGVARIGCTLPEIFDHARTGETVLFDDGRISGQIIATSPDQITIRVEHAAEQGSKLRADKGINVPDTVLPISARTSKDLADLSVVAELADLVEMSFVRNSTDVEHLVAHLDRLGADHLGVILKIETRQAFEQLPQLLLTAMRRQRVGVMIARGDLAVECGYYRLAELQEEILWLCEAAHLPVIWATQVLEQLAKKGNPSRAEISDAAMSERAECVMLNKGPYIDEAVVALDAILRRMAQHQYKTNTLLPPLGSWHPT
ncbi:pyruvate kinase [Mycobacterium sp.]|uniref:pyruvate kinase n=1 Tax=Mycobacterium sp. TaxID=1785 RepID=UPI00121B9CFE|nr:pyruvate kinase [Mycobacterium sp.]TAM68868.1 MAG: hypothetical protein EPN51_11535 [Mycobacterium sp.]